MKNNITTTTVGGYQPPKLEKIAHKKRERKKRLRQMLNYKFLYLMILPGIIYFIIFSYIPMGGIVIAFQDYQPFLGIADSPWVGFKHFIRFFSEPTFFQLLFNTLNLFALSLFISFPLPIIIALLLNEVIHSKFKKAIQTLIYIPHFMSWVIIVSIFYILLSPEDGLINGMLQALGQNKIDFLTDSDWFRPLWIIQNVWKEAGWGTIIYLAAITAVDTQLYESAQMDGASRLRQMWHITLPAIRPVIITLLILKIGSILNLGFEQIYLLMNSLNREVAEVFDTYVYTAGLKNGQLSYSTAVGLFKSVVGLILIIATNKLAKKLGEDGVY